MPSEAHKRVNVEQSEGIDHRMLNPRSAAKHNGAIAINASDQEPKPAHAARHTKHASQSG